MMLKTLHEEFFKELKPIYSVQEIRSLFFIVCENVLKYQKTKYYPSSLTLHMYMLFASHVGIGTKEIYDF